MSETLNQVQPHNDAIERAQAMGPRSETVAPDKTDELLDAKNLLEYKQQITGDDLFDYESRQAKEVFNQSIDDYVSSRPSVDKAGSVHNPETGAFINAENYFADQREKSEQDSMPRDYEDMSTTQLAKALAKAEHENDITKADDLTDVLLEKMSTLEAKAKQGGRDAEHDNERVDNIWDRVMGVKDRELAKLGGKGDETLKKEAERKAEKARVEAEAEAKEELEREVKKAAEKAEREEAERKAEEARAEAQAIAEAIEQAKAADNPAEKPKDQPEAGKDPSIKEQLEALQDEDRLNDSLSNMADKVKELIEAGLDPKKVFKAFRKAADKNLESIALEQFKAAGIDSPTQEQLDNHKKLIAKAFQKELIGARDESIQDEDQGVDLERLEELRRKAEHRSNIFLRDSGSVYRVGDDVKFTNRYTVNEGTKDSPRLRVVEEVVAGRISGAVKRGKGEKDVVVQILPETGGVDEDLIEAPIASVVSGSDETTRSMRKRITESARESAVQRSAPEPKSQPTKSWYRSATIGSIKSLNALRKGEEASMGKNARRAVRLGRGVMSIIDKDYKNELLQRKYNRMPAKIQEEFNKLSIDIEFRPPGSSRKEYRQMRDRYEEILKEYEFES